MGRNEGWEVEKETEKEDEKERKHEAGPTEKPDALSAGRGIR